MNVVHLAEMANDIAAYFQAEPDRSAGLDGMVVHMQRFWEPRMRVQIVDYAREGDTILSPLAHDAVVELGRRLGDPPPPPGPDGGGDAG